MQSRFKNASGAYLLNAMFYETTLSDKSQVIYTLKDTEHEGYPSLYQLYMDADDPTEYSFAINHLDGWGHWERLCECSWFKPHLSRWRRELEIRCRSRELARIRGIASQSGKEAFQAQKYILNGLWKDKPEKRRAGAPSKDEIKDAANRIVTLDRSLEEDLKRITTRDN